MTDLWVVLRSLHVHDWFSIRCAEVKPPSTRTQASSAPVWLAPEAEQAFQLPATAPEHVRLAMSLVARLSSWKDTPLVFAPRGYSKPEMYQLGSWNDLVVHPRSSSTEIDSVTTTAAEAAASRKVLDATIFVMDDGRSMG